MKILYAARMCRYDLPRATCALATKVSKWDETCDARLHRLVSYIQSSLDRRMVAYVGDKLTECQLWLFSDADFAGDTETRRSTSGVFLALVGPATFVPLSAASRKQTCVSHSTTEAEIVAADLAVRSEALPAMTLWDAICDSLFPPAGGPPRSPASGARASAPELGRRAAPPSGPGSFRLPLHFKEDNQATMKIIQSGRSPAMRHVGRTHGVCMAWLHEVFAKPEMKLEFVDTLHQAADIFTKAFGSKEKWEQVCALVSHLPEAGRAALFAPARGASAAAPPSDPGYDRCLVEFCCGPDSLLGRPTRASAGCRVIRVTEREDVTTPAGRTFVLNSLREAARHLRGVSTHAPGGLRTDGISGASARAGTVPLLLFAAIPCTGGSAWQHINVRRPGGKARLARTVRRFQAI